MHSGTSNESLAGGTVLSDALMSYFPFNYTASDAEKLIEVN